MKMSRRARRMQRHHSRLSRKGGLNLVSLMDVFTILVFFLLVNTSDVQTLPSPEDLSLPESKAEKQAEETTVVVVTRDRIMVNGEAVVDHEAALSGDDATIPALAQALDAAIAQRIVQPAEDSDEDENGQQPVDRGNLTIMADKGLPYRLIRKVMFTSTASDFSRISLATMQEGQG